MAPCGYFTDPKNACTCSFGQIHRYRSKISGDLLDRIDIHAEVPAVPYKDLRKEASAESSESIRKGVAAARAMQLERILKIARTIAEAIQYRSMDRRIFR